MADVNEIMKNMDTREKRRVNVMAGTMTIMALIAIGNPIIVLLLYWIFGWQVAVLALPILFILELKYVMPVRQKRDLSRSFIRNLTIWLGRVSLVVLPLLAVIVDDKEIMRLWAILIAIALGPLVADKNFTSQIYPTLTVPRRKWLGFYSTIMTVGTFIGLSELIWHLLPTGFWLFFHASLVVIFTVLTMSIAMLSGKLLGGGEMFVQSEIQSKKPPKKAADDNSIKLKLSAVLPDRIVLDFGDAHLSQAIAIFREFDWPAHPPEVVSHSGFWIKPPYIQISTSFLGDVSMAVCDDRTVKCQFTYEVESKGGLFGKFETKKIREVGVPQELVEQILTLFWVDKSNEMKTLLQSYEIEDND